VLSFVDRRCSSAQVAETGGEVDDGTARFARYKYPAMTKTLGNFSLQVRTALARASLYSSMCFGQRWDRCCRADCPRSAGISACSQLRCVAAKAR